MFRIILQSNIKPEMSQLRSLQHNGQRMLGHKTCLDERTNERNGETSQNHNAFSNAVERQIQNKLAPYGTEVSTLQN